MCGYECQLKHCLDCDFEEITLGTTEHYTDELLELQEENFQGIA